MSYENALTVIKYNWKVSLISTLLFHHKLGPSSAWADCLNLGQSEADEPSVDNHPPGGRYLKENKYFKTKYYQ